MEIKRITEKKRVKKNEKRRNNQRRNSKGNLLGKKQVEIIAQKEETLSCPTRPEMEEDMTQIHQIPWME